MKAMLTEAIEIRDGIKAKLDKKPTSWFNRIFW